jgi:Mrp family chromosome partitioning ATPase
MVQINNNVDAAQKQKKAQAEQDASVDRTLKKIKKKFVVLSGKGGVGKTSTSVNLGIALAEKGFNVGIMDVDLHGPDVPRMLGLKGMLGMSKNNKLDPMRYSDNLKVVSIESLIASKDDAVIWRGPLKYSAIRQFIGEVEWNR